MSTLDCFNLSDFSENVLLVEMIKNEKFSDRTAIFISLSEYLRKTFDWMEVVSAEGSIAVKYNSLDIPNTKAKNLILDKLKEFSYQEESREKSLLRIPVYYSEEFGLDIKDVASEHSLTSQEITDLHSGTTYEVKMIGFTPGFAYLGDLPKELIMPRLSRPRINLLPGSVGISGNRTGVYTLGGPGGWRIIGRTPLKLFDPDKKNPFGISPDMRVKFNPISKQEYESYTI